MTVKDAKSLSQNHMPKIAPKPAPPNKFSLMSKFDLEVLYSLVTRMWFPYTQNLGKAEYVVFDKLYEELKSECIKKGIRI